MAEETKPQTAKAAAPASRADFASLLGIAIALAGILGGLLLEGGRLKDVAQFTAALIVLGGTIGAVLAATPLVTVKRALIRFAGVFQDRSQPLHELIDEAIRYATKARKNGLLSLEDDAEETTDRFLGKALQLAVDGTDLQEIRQMLELEIEMEEVYVEAEAKVFESAGGYAPTIGIIGAVLGLIQVMKNLANIEEVGHGIAVAFVATVYGVGTANLFFLPAASKIKARFAQEMYRKQLIVEAVSAIVEGLNPKIIRQRLEAFDPVRPAKRSAPAERGELKPSEQAVNA
jgi:chemotaxis protein MotA